MKILIIGYGSIGKRHFEILNTFKSVSCVDLVTNRNTNDAVSFKTLEDVNDIESYDYFVICSETVKHYEELKYICSKVSEKKILVEKPLYDKQYEDIKTNNHIFVAYNLRFHPVLEKLRELLKNENIYYANIICGQYLPTWRPHQDYRDSYSADINRGGGVLRDLSHEIDYICWLFGYIDKIDSINTKISDLEINSDDIFTAIAITDNRVIINLTVDYISKIPMRKLIIHTEDKTIEADMIKNTLYYRNKLDSDKTIDIEEADRDHSYRKMHESLLENNYDTACSFSDGKKIIEIIENIEFKEL